MASGRPRPLKGTRAHGLLALGGAVSALGALFFVRAFPGWFDGGLSGTILFCATAAATLAFVFAVRLLTKPGRLVDAVATLCVGALLADGLLLGFAGFLYDGPESVLRHAAAWRLFAGGAALCFAVLLERRPVA